MVGDAESVISIEALELAFDRELVTDKRAAAETAYALAFRYRNEDVDGRRRFDLAKIWATRSIGLLDLLPSERLGEISSTRQFVGGIPIPDLLHPNVVRQRLADVLI